jgi:cbb3-type cytochrome oxidase maturation protein
MSVIIILIIASIFVALLFLIGFIWAVRSGQYDDTFSPSVRMLFEDKEKPEKPQRHKPAVPEAKNPKNSGKSHK